MAILRNSPRDPIASPKVRYLRCCSAYVALLEVDRRGTKIENRIYQNTCIFSKYSDTGLRRQLMLCLFGVIVSFSKMLSTMPPSSNGGSSYQLIRTDPTPPVAYVALRTTLRTFAPGEIVQHDGFRATSLARSIVDAARVNTTPEQILVAVREGLRRNLLTRRDLDQALRTAPVRVQRLIARALT